MIKDNTDPWANTIIVTMILISMVLVIVLTIVNLLKWRIGYMICGGLILCTIFVSCEAGGRAFKNSNYLQDKYYTTSCNSHLRNMDANAISSYCPNKYIKNSASPFLSCPRED